jgi:hypothetical protein
MSAWRAFLDTMRTSSVLARSTDPAGAHPEVRPAHIVPSRAGMMLILVAVAAVCAACWCAPKLGTPAVGALLILLAMMITLPAFVLALPACDCRCGARDVHSCRRSGTWKRFAPEFALAR